MNPSFNPIGGLLANLALLRIAQADNIVHLQLARPDKRNAINDSLITQLHTAFVNLPSDAKVVILSGLGEHFCAGLDLSEITERSVADGIAHSRTWHSAFDAIQFGRVPVIAVLHGAVVGGGLELACAAHLRVAESTAIYALPEGQRGIFVGGGGSVRIPRLVGVSLMSDMMLTGRVLTAQEGQDARLSNYLVASGDGLAQAIDLARKVASNAPLSNFAVMQALPRIADMGQSDGLFVESLMSAIAQGDDLAKQRVRDFLQKRSSKVGITA